MIHGSYVLKHIRTMALVSVYLSNSFFSPIFIGVLEVHKPARVSMSVCVHRSLMKHMPQPHTGTPNSWHTQRDTRTHAVLSHAGKAWPLSGSISKQEEKCIISFWLFIWLLRAEGLLLPHFSTCSWFGPLITDDPLIKKTDWPFLPLDSVNENFRVCAVTTKCFEANRWRSTTSQGWPFGIQTVVFHWLPSNLAWSRFLWHHYFGNHRLRQESVPTVPCCTARLYVCARVSNCLCALIHTLSAEATVCLRRCFCTVVIETKSSITILCVWCVWTGIKTRCTEIWQGPSVIPPHPKSAHPALLPSTHWHTRTPSQ